VNGRYPELIAGDMSVGVMTTTRCGMAGTLCGVVQHREEEAEVVEAERVLGVVSGMSV
jgi:hypothetical protein